MSLLTSLSRRTIVKSVPIYAEGDQSMSMLNCIMAAKTYFPITYEVDLLEGIFSVAALFWLAIMVILMMVVFMSYLKTMRVLKGARQLRDNIYVSDELAAPAVYGILRPRIVLQPECREEDMKYIILHENTHISRKDNLWRLVAVITSCVHWFNPFSWIFLKSFMAATELACDEAVLARSDENEARSYAAALLNHAERRGGLASPFGGAKLSVRIRRILSYKRISAFSAGCFISLAAAICYVLLTNPK